MYPLKFEPIYIEKIWAGSKLNKIRAGQLKKGIGISWEVSAHPNATNIISNGRFKGMTLKEIVEKEGVKIIGTDISSSDVLRIAYLDAKEDLSIQVHPGKEYAAIHENDGGKSELWYILEADEGAYVIAGTSITDKKSLKEAALSNTLSPYLNKIPVKKGDIVNIKSGLIHALGKGILAIEIGQNGDTTYRIYDYDRGRKLDLEKGLDVLDLELKCKKPNYISLNFDSFVKEYCFISDEYCVEIINVIERYIGDSNPKHFYIYTCVEGNCIIEYEKGYEKINMGDSVFIPASLGNYCFRGKCKLLKSYISSVNTIKNDIFSNITY